MLSTQILLIIVAALPSILSFFGGSIPFLEGPATVYQIAYFAPFLVMGLTALLGIRLNQTRIFLSSLLLLSAYALLTIPQVQAISSSTAKDMAAIVSVAIPLGLILLFIMRDNALLSVKGLLMLVASFGPLALFLLAHGLGILSTDTLYISSTHLLLPFWHLPQAALAGIILFIIQSALMRRTPIGGFMQTLVIGFIPIFATLNGAVPRLTSLNFIALSIILFYAIYRVYWQKIYIDELTGVHNRRAFDEALRTVSGDYTVAMIDIDRFKKFNDTYGHSSGDEVLRFVGSTLKSRAAAKVYRYGGEEFGIIFYREYDEDLLGFVDKIRKRLADRTFHIRSPQLIRDKKSKKHRGKKKWVTKTAKITISVGLAGNTNPSWSPTDVLEAADKSLYKAKKAGRNRVVAA